MLRTDGLHAAWTDWLSTFQWHYFATLTFAQPRTEASAARAFASYVRSLRQRQDGGDIGYFCGYEYGGAGRLHLHALLRAGTGQTEFDTGGRPHTPGSLPPEILWEVWFKRFGRAQVAAYDPRRGAAGYVSKYVTKRLAYYDIDNMMPLA